mmetsp:Transcript_38129/g.61476  ORF Transcript_38129/g.61476 Transcript_38129/m.61476 type:complete len:203 (+) Transcript_38129:721-1329(+)
MTFFRTHLHLESLAHPLALPLPASLSAAVEDVQAQVVPLLVRFLPVALVREAHLQFLPGCGVVARRRGVLGGLSSPETILLCCMPVLVLQLDFVDCLLQLGKLTRPVVSLTCDFLLDLTHHVACILLQGAFSIGVLRQLLAKLAHGVRLHICSIVQLLHPSVLRPSVEVRHLLAQTSSEGHLVVLSILGFLILLALQLRLLF